MKVLAIATSTEQVGVALGGPDGTVASVRVCRGRRHAEVLAPAIDSLTRLSGIPLDEVERIAVDVGPGLFTGIRVGVATAKALASALGLEVVACSSLDLLARPHRSSTATVASVVDARRGEVFWALYRHGEAVTTAAATTPGQLAEAISASLPVLAVGDGARRYAPELAAAGATVGGPGFEHPDPAVLAELAPTGTALAASAVQPVYIRAPDVRIGWAQREVPA